MERRLIDVNKLYNQVDQDFYDIREHSRSEVSKCSGLSVHLGEHSHFLYLMEKQPAVSDPIDTIKDISEQVESLDCNSVNQSYSDGYADAVADFLEILERAFEKLSKELDES